mmetsp:Transcript_23992/g.75434  ORF Transcript_23992/g.75434 Transcript_23992/m.75434 type:complete len:303 (-) Transcript_23992:1674-2582(-)
MSRRKPVKSSATSSVQSRARSSFSSLTLFSPMRLTPSERTSLRTSSLGRPEGGLPSAGNWPLLSAASWLLARKTCRKSSTSFCEKLSSFMRLFMRSSSACSCSVSSILDSCTKVQKPISPDGLTLAMPASRARSRATSSFFISSVCSCRDLGCQPNSARMPMSSPLSISPLLSLSNRLKTCWSSEMRSSVKPAFLRSLATTSARQRSTILTKRSKSKLPDCMLACLSITGGSCPRSFRAWLVCFPGSSPSVSLRLSKTTAISRSSASRCSCMSFKYSLKSRQLLLFSSTWDTKMWIWSIVTR